MCFSKNKEESPCEKFAEYLFISDQHKDVRQLVITGGSQYAVEDFHTVYWQLNKWLFAGTLWRKENFSNTAHSLLDAKCLFECFGGGGFIWQVLPTDAVSGST